MFFQNLHDQEFRGTLMTSDRKYTLNFNIKANQNRGDLMIAWNKETYDLSSLDTLTLNYAMDFNSPNFASLAINVAGTTPAATRAYEVVNALNANEVFAAIFVASLSKIDGGDTVMIKTKRDRTQMKTFISNTGAERKLRFNKKATVAELPAYFTRHTMDESANYPDMPPGILLALDEGDAVDQEVITLAGLDHTDMKADWELLAGRSDAFWFEKRAYSVGKLVESIRYPAGAQVGDLAKKTVYTYTGSDMTGEMELPYVLESGDLITPP